jgi:hypothetical protein
MNYRFDDEEEFFDCMDGFYAADGGMADSGIKDGLKREAFKLYLHALMEDGRTNSQIVSRKLDARIMSYIRAYFTDESRVEQGYGLEDLHNFLEWLRDEMEIPL